MPEPRRILVLILGASRFPKLPLDDNPAFENSARLLQQYFQNEREGPGGYTVDSLFDSDLPVADQADHIRDLLAQHTEATDLVIYYVGHGAFLRSRSREYFLALRSTRRPGEELTGLRPETLSDIVNEHFINRRVYVILDCCFAGEAVHEFQSDGLGKLAEHGILRRGTALLVASSKDEPAISPIGRPHTMFCECLLHVLTTGVPGGSRYLSLEEVAEQLRHVLVDKFQELAVLPEIHSPRQPLGNVAKEPLFANPAYSAPQLPKDIQNLLKSELTPARKLAVEYLEKMLDDEDGDVVMLGRRHLERLAANDDSKMIARLAMTVLERNARAVDSVAESDIPADFPAEGEGEGADQEPGHSDGQPGPAAPEEPRADEPTAGPPQPPPGEVRVSVKPARSTTQPNSSVKWTCTVSNPLSTSVRDITVTDGEERVLAEPFDLAPGAVRRLRFQRTYGTRGGRLTVQARGRDERGQPVTAEGSGRVRVSTPPRDNKAPRPKTSPNTPAAAVTATTAGAKSRPSPSAPPTPAPSFPLVQANLFDTGIRGLPAALRIQQPQVANPASTAAVPARPVNPILFRAALRRVKATAEVADTELNTMIRLVEEGERHYRVVVGDLTRPPNWQKSAEAWARDAAVARDEDVVMLKLAPPSKADILDNLRRLVRQIELATGVPIPLSEFS